MLISTRHLEEIHERTDDWLVLHSTQTPLEMMFCLISHSKHPKNHIATHYITQFSLNRMGHYPL